MQKWNSEITHKLYDMSNINTFVGIIEEKDHPAYVGYKHYLLPNGIHAYFKPTGCDAIFTYEDITNKYINSKEKPDPKDPYFSNKFPISEVYFERFAVEGTSNKGTQLVFGNNKISFDEDGKIYSSVLEKPTQKGGYDDEIVTKGSSDSIENIIKNMLEKYVSFKFPENSHKKEVFENALKLYSDLKATGISKKITPEAALKGALATTTLEQVSDLRKEGYTKEQGDRINDRQ